MVPAACRRLWTIRFRTIIPSPSNTRPAVTGSGERARTTTADSQGAACSTDPQRECLELVWKVGMGCSARKVFRWLEVGDIGPLVECVNAAEGYAARPAVGWLLSRESARYWPETTLWEVKDGVLGGLSASWK
jgi:hypothetical protein